MNTGVDEKKVSEAAIKFKKNQNNAKRNITARLGRKPTGAEILGLVKVRRQQLNEEAFFDKVMAKAVEREAIKMDAKQAAKAAAAAVREKKKAAEMEAKALLKEAMAEAKKNKTTTRKVSNAAAKKAENKLFMKATKEQEKAIKAAEKEAKKEEEKVAKKLERESKLVEKAAVKALTKEAFEVEMERARANLTRAIGKPPRVANIRRLAAIRKSGANINVTNYLKVRNYTAKKKNSNLKNLFRENVGNVQPPMDVCAACELKKFLERENA